MTKKLDKKRHFIISNDTYKQDILVCLNMTNKEIIKALKKNHSELTQEDIEQIENDKDFKKNNVCGCMYKLEQGYVISLKWYKDTFRKNLCVAMHEIMHITHYILRNVRISLRENTEEAYTYLFESLMEKFLFELY